MQKNKSGYKKVKSLYGTYEKIPEDWDHSILSNFLTFNMGQSPPSESYNENQDGLPFFQGVTEFRYMYPEHKFWCSEPKKVAKKDQILFSVRAPVGEINISKTECCIGRGLTAVIPKNDHLRYCYYSLYYFKNHFIQYSQGTTYDAIDKNSLKIIKIPYTSNKDEQQKIASILSGVDALIESTQHIIEKTERLKKSLMQKLLTRGIGHTKFKKTKSFFGKYVEIPKEWKAVSQGKICQFVNGYAYSQSEFRENGYPIIRIQNLTGGKNFVYSDVKLPEKQFALKGDLLFAWSATFGPFIWNGSKAAFHYHQWKVIPNEGIDKIFLYYHFSRIASTIKSMGQSGLGMSHMTKNGIEKMLINLPSSSEQQNIASILSGVDAIKHHNIIALITLRIKLAIFLTLFVWILGSWIQQYRKKPTPLS